MTDRHAADVYLDALYIDALRAEMRELDAEISDRTRVAFEAGKRAGRIEALRGVAVGLAYEIEEFRDCKHVCALSISVAIERVQRKAVEAMAGDVEGAG